MKHSKTDVISADGSSQLDRNVHESERDRSFPDGGHAHLSRKKFASPTVRESNSNAAVENHFCEIRIRRIVLSKRPRQNAGAD
jgi:hypothetical protein